MTANNSTRKKGIFYGWWVVIAASIIHFWGSGVFIYSFTAFFNPLVEEFKWSYTATSFAASFRSLESGIASPVVGFLTDRVGPKRLIMLGAVLTGLACMLMSRIGSLGAFYATFIFLSVGASLMFPVPGWTAVAQWFSRKGGTAMGIIVSAVGFSGVLIFLVNWLIAQYGWRTTFIIGGVGMWAIGIPLALLIKPPPDQASISRQVHTHNGPAVGGFSVRQAARTRAFWMLTLAATVSGFAQNALVVHVMPSLISVQLSREFAGSVASMVALSSVLGRIGFGWLGDRMDKRYLLAITLVMEAVGALIFAYTRNAVSATAFLLLFGSGAGGLITLRLTMQSDYFGRRSFGSIQGLMQAVHAVGSMLGPIFAGLVYDVSGTYYWAWITVAVVVSLTIPLALAMPAVKEREGAVETV